MNMYTNPPLVVKDESLRDSAASSAPAYHPDPYVLKWNGKYYAYATAEAGVTLLTSKDMKTWTFQGFAYQEEGRSGYWAPAVMYDNGQFYLYVSNMPSGGDDVHQQFMRVAVSASLEGPFEYRKTLFDTFSIDAHVVRDTDGGFVLFYSTNETYGIDPHRAGTVILADRLLDPFTPEGKPKLIVRPTLDEEVFAVNRFGDGRNWHTIEGAFHLKRGAKHYVMYSGNAYTSPYYYVGYSMADHAADHSLTELEWSKYPDDDTYEPLLRQNAKVEGVGHNSVAKAPNNVDDWIVYHGREVRGDDAADEKERRQLRMDPLLWHGDRMMVPGPSWEAVAAPAMPAFRDLFDRKDTAQGDEIGSGWTTNGGEWRIDGGSLLQASQFGISRAFVEPSYAHALFELNVRWERSHMGGLYGAVLQAGDETSLIEVLFDAGKRTIGIYETVRGIRLEQRSRVLPVGFRFDVYHQVVIRTSGNAVMVELDGVQTLSASCVSPVQRYGLVTHYTSVCFAGISLTGFLSFLETGAAACLSACEVSAGDWSAAGTALTGCPTAGLSSLRLNNPFQDEATTCRFELEGGIAKLQLSLVSANGEVRSVILQDNSIVGGCTWFIRHAGQRLHISMDGETVLSESVQGETWRSIAVSSERKIILSQLEWTALGS
ncbi:hypothetical protein B1748_30920 [Paenibacillus sp. MY03]|uniref:glycoside hydrolase family 43 protein n=1 Tax=Paenibacillus sp. MY03 TaxID=302980 RepID=UPI000B3C5580|nr:glycoside hydrolase family 43 protein [Paenibacillus sp. MY03]OUS69580.1 hypothetical protein B1748_30920 [Paenibacillus sp. MY03]